MNIPVAATPDTQKLAAVNPFDWFMHDARIVKKRLEKCQDREGCRKGITLLGEILRCYSKLLTGVYVCIYLEKDYLFEKNDRYVFEFFLNKYLSHNEMIGLCELLKHFLKTRSQAAGTLPYLFQDGFKNVRLLSPPITIKDSSRNVGKLKRYGEHVFQVIETLHYQRQVKGLAQNFFVNWTEREFLEVQEHLTLYEDMRYARSQPASCALPLRWVGECFVRNAEDDYRLDLSPAIIALRDEDLHESLAVIANYRGDAGDIVGRFESHGLLKYRELAGHGKAIYSNDESLFTAMFYKIGSLLEEPEFKQRFELIENRDFKIDLFSGDIFDLNFLRKEVKRKGLVNVTYTSPSFHTPLSMRLEMLSGRKLEDVLTKKDKLKVSRGQIFPGAGGKLNFDVIFHCPVYDVDPKQPKDPLLKYIDVAIKNLIEQCASENIDVLVVPAIGSYWGEQERYKVARTWCRNIRNIGIDHPLRRIIFAFINEQALDVYDRTIRQESSVRISLYHWPIREIMGEINRGLLNEDFHARFENCLKLCEYIHYFLVAWAIKALLLQCRNNNSSRPGKAVNEFLRVFRERHMYNTRMDNAGAGRSSKTGRKINPLGIGGWRYFCSLARQAIKSSPWNYDEFIGADKARKEEFHNIIGGGPGSDELINLRNRFHGHDLSLKANESNSARFMRISNRAYEIICSYLDAMPFLRNTELALVLVKNFEIIDLDRDECAVSFFEIDKDAGTSDNEKLSLPISRLNGMLFETGKVYLLNRDFNLEKKELPFALNMHPFLVYGKCAGCGRESLFCWNNFHQDDEGNYSLDYGCIACGALNADIITRAERVNKCIKHELDCKFDEIIKKLLATYMPQEAGLLGTSQ